MIIIPGIDVNGGLGRGPSSTKPLLELLEFGKWCDWVMSDTFVGLLKLSMINFEFVKLTQNGLLSFSKTVCKITSVDAEQAII